jgi:hypothetical protein
MLIDTQSTDKKVMKLNVTVRKINEEGLSSLLYCFTYVGDYALVFGVAKDRVNELLEENFTLNDLKIDTFSYDEITPKRYNRVE